MTCSNRGRTRDAASYACKQCGLSIRYRSKPRPAGEGVLSPQSADRGRSDIAWSTLIAWMSILSCANVGLLLWTRLCPGWPEAFGQTIGCAVLVIAILGVAIFSGAKRPRRRALILMAALIAVPMAGVAERNLSGNATIATSGDKGDLRH